MFGNHGLCGLLEEGTHEKSPKCLSGNLGDFGEFCKGLLLALKTKAGLRLRRTSLATVLAPPRSAKSGNGRGSGRRRPTEIGDGKDNAELAAFTGDFIDGHGVLYSRDWMVI